MRSDILTVAGQYFSFIDPASSQFGIVEIAHALSNICRFAGHTREFYSVAQHSVYVSYLVPKEHALAGLLHDAAEAFTGDVTKPLKNLLPDFQVIEKQVEAAVFARFGLPAVLPPCVKKADLIMLATEKRDLMARTSGKWEWQSIPGIKPMVASVTPLAPLDARQWFLERFSDVIRGL